MSSVEPVELRNLPPEVIHLVHAVDRMRDNWAEGDAARKAQLWREVHAASDAVWDRVLEAQGPLFKDAG